jgi:hypothetical protein
MDVLTLGVLSEAVMPQAIWAKKGRGPRMGGPRRRREPGCGRHASSNPRRGNANSPTIASASRRITIMNGRLQEEVGHPDSSSQRSAISRVIYAAEQTQRLPQSA